MRILITGICGFTGSILARELRRHIEGAAIFGLDNLMRPGSESNRTALQNEGIPVIHADLRSAADILEIPPADWVIDAAANPSVLAGVDGKTSSRQLTEHNLLGTINLLEYCKRHRSGFILLSTSRVYSVELLASLKVRVRDNAYVPDLENSSAPAGVSPQGISEDFGTGTPVSLYGATKLSSEIMASEYGVAFQFPVWINRCGVLAGAGQFGRADQGIISYWIHSWRSRRPLQYIGFDGQGHQVRDILHPGDIVPLLHRQFNAPPDRSNICNIGGGAANSMSLAQLSRWCHERFGPHRVESAATSRPHDVPWLVMNSGRAGSTWDWKPVTPVHDILQEIATHAEKHPDWLDRSSS